jgi:hypothetical protein
LEGAKIMQYKVNVFFKESGIFTTSFAFDEEKKRPKMTLHYSLNLKSQVFLDEEETGLQSVLTFDPKNKKLYFDSDKIDILEKEVRLYEEKPVKKATKRVRKVERKAEG